ncbi:unnamed protein product [Allacma fusca]|uniref:LIM zinc-binding domain-containing protein n=1 Tax=Allacma fusca TaxID=39272 RepID=A0A8J2KF63_9HEXA|nr:unnamed protein product [Allacma fusca]
MLNNGHVSGMGTPDGGQSGMYGHPGGPGDYPPNNYLGPSPNSGNGLMGHHSGGICSQMALNQTSCPPNTKQCAGCQGPIMERYLLHALDRFWHHSCLKCNHCGTTLADVGVSCFTRDGLVLCRHDYVKLFGGGGSCNGCGQGIPPSELVMRAGVPPPGSSPPLVYHMKCFMCSKCAGRLSPGDRYSVINGALYCESDALKMMKNGIGSPSNANVATTNGPAAPRKGKVGRPRRSRD